jgi:hypothetical protein
MHDIAVSSVKNSRIIIGLLTLKIVIKVAFSGGLWTTFQNYVILV